MNILEHPLEVKKRIGYLPENPPLYPEMTVREYLQFAGEVKKVPKQELPKRIDEVMQTVGITDVAGRLVRNLSKGYKQRVGLAQAMIGKPDILILDEPTAGLDPKQILEIRQLIKDLGKSHTVILSSHILPEVSAVCKRVLIINQGKIVADDTPENLAKRLLGGSHLLIRIDGTPQQVESALRKVENVRNLSFKESQEPGTVEVVVESDKDKDIRRDISKALGAAGLPILMMRSLDMTLEEIFLHLTTKEEEVAKV